MEEQGAQKVFYFFLKVIKIYQTRRAKDNTKEGAVIGTQWQNHEGKSPDLLIYADSNSGGPSVSPNVLQPAILPQLQQSPMLPHMLRVDIGVAATVAEF
ncbi:hypothetical protein SCA6_001596 [Theobroma cacao]